MRAVEVASGGKEGDLLATGVGGCYYLVMAVLCMGEWDLTLVIYVVASNVQRFFWGG